MTWGFSCLGAPGRTTGMPWKCLRERSCSATYSLGLRRVAFLASLAWAFALPFFGLPSLPASLAKHYQGAKAPLHSYCQHGDKEKVTS